MFYVVVKNLDVVRCIDHNKDDIYVDGMALNCTADLYCAPDEFLREINVFCTKLPGEVVRAKIYKS